MTSLVGVHQLHASIECCQSIAMLMLQAADPAILKVPYAVYTQDRDSWSLQQADLSLHLPANSKSWFEAVERASRDQSNHFHLLHFEDVVSCVDTRWMTGESGCSPPPESMTEKDRMKCAQQLHADLLAPPAAGTYRLGFFFDSGMRPTTL